MRKFKFTLIAFMAAMMAHCHSQRVPMMTRNLILIPTRKSMRITITSTYLSP